MKFKKFNLYSGFCGHDDCHRDALVSDQHKIASDVLPGIYLLVFLLSVSLFPDLLFQSDQYAAKVALLIALGSFLWRFVYWAFNRARFARYTIQQKKRDLLYVIYAGPAGSLLISLILASQVHHNPDIGNILSAAAFFALALITATALSAIPVASVLIIVMATVPFTGLSVATGNPMLVKFSVLTCLTSLFLVYLVARSFWTFAETIFARERLEAEKKLSHKANDAVYRLAYVDPLTDLPNKRKFLQMLRSAASVAAKGGSEFAIALVEIDNLKLIEDAYGVMTRQSLLRQMADRLGEFVKDKGKAAKLNENLFAILADDINSIGRATILGEDLQMMMRADFAAADKPLTLTASCGISLYRFCDGDLHRLIRQGRLALEDARSRGQGNTGIYNMALDRVQTRKLEVEKALRRALAEDVLEAWFQPVVRLDNNEIAGFESLARWFDAELGPVGPDEFITIAEETGLIYDLTLLQFEKSVRTAVSWPQDVRLFFNLSAKILARQEVAEKLFDIADAAGFDISRLDIEITETTIALDGESASNTVMCLRAAGVKIAIDDFGTGYSGLSQFLEYPIDKIKIDKSFTDRMCNEPHVRDVVRTIVNLGKALGIECVAEGIEDYRQYGLLCDLGCDYGQGYLLSQPVSADKTLRRIHHSLAA